MTKDLNKARLLLLSAFTGVALLGCSDSGADITDDNASLEGSTIVVPTTSVAPTTSTTTVEQVISIRKKIAGDLQFIMPTIETAAAILTDGFSGNYEITGEQAIGIEQTLWPWAVGFIGGWERSYEFETDLMAPMRRPAVTTRVLLFASEKDAVVFSSRVAREFGPGLRSLEYDTTSSADELIKMASDDSIINALVFRTQYRVTSDARSRKAGAGNVRGPVLVWTTFEDSYTKFFWDSEAETANTKIFRELLAKYPELAE